MLPPTTHPPTTPHHPPHNPSTIHLSPHTSPTPLTRLAIDARHIRPQLSGIGRYTRVLLRGLAQIDNPLPNGEPILLITNRNTPLPDDVLRSKNFRYTALNASPHSFASQHLLPKILRQHRIQLLHCPDAFAPLLAPRTKILITIHDLIPITCHHLLGRSRKGRFLFLWKRWLKLQCRRATAITTVSNHSAIDIRQLLHIPKSKIHSMYGAIEPHTPVHATVHDEKRILYVGRHDPYKNLVKLVHAFRKAYKTYKITHHDAHMRLIIAGSPDPRYVEAQATARQLEIHHHVDFPGYLDDDALHALYECASVFVFPSLYEGFGLPPLEAMSRGLPVIASDRTAMPEILGDAALLIDPDDINTMAHAIVSVLSDRPTSDHLRAAGLARSRQFTPRIMAQRALEIYNQIVTQ